MSADLTNNADAVMDDAPLEDTISHSGEFSPTRSLRLLVHYLNFLLESYTFSPQETTFLWDWEMVREAINPYKPSAVFSGVLWYGLEMLEGLNDDTSTGKIVYAEGTRRELLWHLSNLMTAYRKRLPEIETDETPFPSNMNLTAYVQKPEWKEVLSKVRTLMRLDESVDRLLLLLTRYVEPMPIDPSQVSVARIHSYKEQLDRIRKTPESEARNDADAWNLASVESLSDRSGQLKRNVELVTATRVLGRIARRLTKDPFYFALELQIRKDFPDRHSRLVILHQMLAKLHTFAAQFGAIEGLDSTQDKPFMGRREVPRVFETFRSLSLIDDPLLREVWRLVVRAGQALEDSRLQSKVLSNELDLSSGSQLSLARFEQKISTVLEVLGIARPVAEDINLSWQEIWRHQSVRRHHLISGPGKLLIEAEISETSVALRWTSGCSLQGFIRAMEKVAMKAGFDKTLHVLIRAQGSGGFELDAKDCDELIRKIRSSVTSRISLFRIVTPEINYWYDLSKQLSSQGGPIRLRDAFVAVTMPRMLDYADLFAEFYNDTSARWLFPTAISDTFKQLIKIY